MNGKGLSRVEPVHDANPQRSGLDGVDGWGVQSWY
jgi:hypothetical protein